MTAEEIYQYLKDNGIYAEVSQDSLSTEVTIEYGDWKHEHLRCRFLMQEIGYEHWKEEAQPSDEDVYTATHTFLERTSPLWIHREAFMKMFA